MTKHSVCCASCLRNHTSLSFTVHLWGMMISPGVFFIFSKFWFSGLLGGKKDKKWPKMRKTSVCRAPYLKNHTSFFFYLGFFNKYSRFTGQQGKEKAISLWLTLAIWLVSRYIFSTAKRLFTGCLRIVLVFAVLTIASLTSESLLGNSHVTMAIIQKSLSTFS